MNGALGTCTERTRTASRREVVGAASRREVLGIGHGDKAEEENDS
ncbi:MAG: hypothetical protein V7K14_10830 [Nostoc sp.]